MPETSLHRPALPALDPGLARALARAAENFGRLDQALAGHPLLPAFLYRARLAAVRHQAAADGKVIDPWHLAAVLEGLRLRMDHALRIVDRGMIFDAARHALSLHQWLVEPDFDQEGEVQHAQRLLSAAAAATTPLLAAASGVHGWLEASGTRPPIRAALVRHWTKHGLLGAAVPLTGAKALQADTDWDFPAWAPSFLAALADEAAEALNLLRDLHRGWLSARTAVSGRRRNSRAAAAVDFLAAAPLLSATTLAAGLGMAIKNAAALLEEFRAAGIAVEVTHRSARRLYGLAGLAPLRDQIAPPRRPMPGRSRGRPASVSIAEAVPPAPSPEPPTMRIRPPPVDFAELERCMAHAEQAIRHTRRTLDALARGEPASATAPSCAEPALAGLTPEEQPEPCWPDDRSEDS